MPFIYAYCLTISRKKFFTLKYILMLVVFYSFSLFLLMNPTVNADDEYSLLPFRRPISAIIKTNFISNSKENDIKIISKVYNYNELKNCNTNHAVFLQTDYSDPETDNKEARKQFIRVAIKLIIYNLKTYLKDRAIISENFTNFITLRDKLCEEERKNPNSIEDKTLNLLEGLDNNYNPTIYNKIMYSPIIPFFIVLFSVIYFLIKHNYSLVIISLLSLLISILQYLTLSEPYFHYFIQIYLLGYYYLFYILVLITNKIYIYLKKKYLRRFIDKSVGYSKI